MVKTANYISVCIYLALVVTTIAVFWQMHSFDFINYDDPKYIINNPNVTTGLSVDGLIWAFTTQYFAGWCPVTWLSQMLDCQLFGMDAGRHHLTNLLLHIVNTLLLFWVLRAMTGAIWRSAFIAALFALHPMHVESVAWLSERKDVLSTMFWLLTLGAYTHYIKKPCKTRYFLIILPFLFGLMAKPMLVTLPFTLLLLDYWPFERFRWKALPRLLWEKTPLFILSAVFCVVTFIVQHEWGAVATLSGTPFDVRIANGIISYVKYIWKMFWPSPLAIPYPYPDGMMPLWQPVSAALVLLAVSVCVILLARSRKYILVGWLWYLGTLVPVIGLVQVGNQALADRYTYVSFIGLFIIIAWGMPELLAGWRYRKIAIVASSFLIFVVLSVCSYRQIGYWRNTETLFNHALEVTEDNYIAHLCLAADMHDQNRLDEAIWHYSEGLRIKPSYSKAHYAYIGLGRALSEQGRLDSAIATFKKALYLDPNYVDAYSNLGQTYSQQGRLGEAAEQYRQGLRIEPNNAGLLNSMGIIFGREGKFNEAISHFNKAIDIAPDFASGYINLGYALIQQGKYDQALPPLTEAVRLDPNSARAHYHLARVLAEAGRTEESIAQLKEALRASLDWVEAMNDLAWVLTVHPQAELRDPQQAIRLAERSCELTGYKRPDLFDTLAAAYASAGRFSEAVAAAEKAIKLAESLDQKQLIEDIQNRLRLYRAGKPYIESPEPGNG